MKKVALVVLTTVPNKKTAEVLSRLVLENKLAACVNVFPLIESLFWWKGKVVKEKEILLFIKTTSVHFSRLEKLIKDNHPYQIPEMIGLPIVEGFKPYLDWIWQAGQK